jgi:serine/threonine protein kinase
MRPGAGRAEARSAARVDHRSVVTVHDFLAEEGDGVDWIIMEALSGATLATVIRRHGPIGTDEAWYVAWHLLEALGAVHDAGLTHGDVKPGNVQLCSDGRVVHPGLRAGWSVPADRRGRQEPGRRQPPLHRTGDPALGGLLPPIRSVCARHDLVRGDNRPRTLDRHP